MQKDAEQENKEKIQQPAGKTDASNQENNGHESPLMLMEEEQWKDVPRRSIACGVQILKRPDRETRDFRNFIMDYGLMELPLAGRKYIWSNATVSSNIDRALINTAWMSKIHVPDGAAKEPLCSYHSPLCLELEGLPAKEDLEAIQNQMKDRQKQYLHGQDK
ncbi:hypothetical protein HAX54_005447, partial [Datura stramonium]|nr:hypothetical protein [Datura stramonium]